MKRLRLLILFSVSCFIVGGVEAQLTSPGSGDPIKGKVIYENNCLICHGDHGKGDGLLGASLRPQPTDLTGPEVRGKSDKDLRTVIHEGRGVMPAWKTRLNEQDIQNVLAYIRNLGE